MFVVYECLIKELYGIAKPSKFIYEDVIVTFVDLYFVKLLKYVSLCPRRNFNESSPIPVFGEWFISLKLVLLYAYFAVENAPLLLK